MNERLRVIRFENFRGLPSSDITLGGKSFVLLGTNGKGKSAVVDGIEFLFSGRVGRFTGVGTGAINHDEAIRHILKLGAPKVRFTLSPSNKTISRELGQESIVSGGGDAAHDFINSHPEVDAFILRRARILDFVSDQDANRYQKFVKLLGIGVIDRQQRTFADAEKMAKEAVERTDSGFRAKLAVFQDPADGFSPSSVSDVLARMSLRAAALSVGGLLKWADIGSILDSLKALRPAVNSTQLDSSTRAVVCLENPLPADVTADISAVNEQRIRMVALRDSLADAPRARIVTEAIKYLSQHSQESECPVCEQGLARPTAELIVRLQQRADTLKEFSELTDSRRAALRRIVSYCEGIAAQISRDLEHQSLLNVSLCTLFEHVREQAKSAAKSVLSMHATFSEEDLALPSALESFREQRATVALGLGAKREALILSDTSQLEATIVLLERGSAGHAELVVAENTVVEMRRLSERSSAVREAFSIARESSIQKVFNAIASTVLDFYQRLHDSINTSDRSECTGLELRSTSRASAGGLRLAIQFLSAEDTKDPRAFLSEGHLDSLGLCLFLATVKIFNAPGTLLVLDDVMTSIDRDHRRRVGELLFQEFSDFQVVITTHDEHWRDLLRSSAEAWGIQSKWSFATFEGWTLATGPQVSVVASSWEFIEAHMNEKDYRELGGSLRLVFESFLKRCAEKLEVKLRFQMNPKYTAADFVFAGIHNTIRDRLIAQSSSDEVQIRTDVARVFGQADLLNFLSHDNPGRLEITFDQTRDFVQGLRDLTRRCEAHKLMKGFAS